MKKLYVRPEVETVEFNRTDIIATSNPVGTGGTGEDAGWGED